MPLVRHLVVATLALGLLAPLPADAKTFKWAFTGDVATLDPYAVNETFTVGFLGAIYEGLVMRGKNLEIVPGLATSWSNVSPDVWRFKLRPNVKFHDGTPFTPDDVIFSFERATREGSDVADKVQAIREVRKVDDLTVDIVTKGPAPLLTSDISDWYIMSRAWAEKHGATGPSSIKKSITNYATTNANGTGPFLVQSRQPDARTVLVPNPAWWGKPEHNLTEVIFTPVKSDATRVAALLSGEIDMMFPVPLQDIDRLKNTKGVRPMQGRELRTIFLGMDQFRPELLESSVKGKNPLKDIRVRRAMYQAIDIDAIHKRIMRGASTPTAIMIGPGVNGFDESLNKRYPYDLAAAKKLLAEAGYPQGFELGMDCPNDRYVNDEKICQAVAGMLAKIGIKVNLLAQTKAKYFEKILSQNTSFYILGWLPPSYDAHSNIFSVLMTRDASVPGQGAYNVGGYSNKRVDELGNLIRQELDPKKRQAMISEVMKLHKEEFGHIPLHQQALAWGVRDSITLVQRADSTLDLRYVTVK
jgi:peptide/nickel transport system substrate-binding protein